MSKSKTVSAQYRQGDVQIERISALPQGLMAAARENGRVILAHGEVTGHAHAFLESEAEKLVDAKGAEFFRIGGTEINVRLPIVRRWKSQVMVQHPDHGIIEFAEADVLIAGNEVIIEGEFGLLRHDEHTAHAIPAGFYKGGNGANGTVRQREYSPEAIRNVAD